MIEILLRRDETVPCSPTKGVRWIAEIQIGIRKFSATSRNGASYELARQLVAAGIPDQPIRIRQGGIAGSVAWPSLHKHALRTIAEGAARSIREEKWSPHPDGVWLDRFLPKQGVKGVEGTLGPLAASPA